MTGNPPASTMTASSCRPSAALRVGHRTARDVVALLGLVLAMVVGALVLAAQPASAAPSDLSGTRVAAINPESATLVEAQPGVSPGEVGSGTVLFDDGTSGCCVAPQGAIGPAGDAAAAGLSRMDRFRNLADTGFDVGGQRFSVNPHMLNSLRKSGRRHIDSESLVRSLDTIPSPGTPGSRVFTDPSTGTRWFVNDANAVVGVWPAGFKG